MGMGRRRWLWWVNSLVMSELVPDRYRPALLTRAGIQVGAGTLIHAGSYFAGPNVSLGDGVFVNNQVFFDRGAPIQVGARASLAMRVSLITSSHAIGPPAQRTGADSWVPLPITIGDGAWIGAGAMILPGVTIGTGSVVAAGAVVTRDVSDHVLVVGIPAKAVKDLPR